MSLGFPIHLAPHGVAWAYTRACHATAAVCILVTMLFMLLLDVAYPGRLIWPTALLLLPMLGALWLLDRRPGLASTVIYLTVGSASLYGFVLAGSFVYPTSTSSDTFIFTLPKIALILVGGVGVGVLPAIAWMFAAFVIGGVVTVLAAMPSGMPAKLDGTTITTVALLASVLGLIALGESRIRGAKPRLNHAAREEQRSSERQTLEVRAAAILHDTVLGDLAAIAATPDGALPATMREQLEADVASLSGDEWLRTIEAAEPSEPQGWQESRLAAVVAEFHGKRLAIEVSGDRAAVLRLTLERAETVALAVRQCLVNVVEHAGTDRAEVVLYGSESEISIMVVDAGSGFVVENTGADRLGLRCSVRERIEAIGGTVQVWSTPGRGTSVLIRVPAELDDSMLTTDDAEARR